MGQVPSRGPYDSNRLLAARSRSRSRGSLLSRSSSAAVTVTSSGPEQVRSFLSVDEDSDTIFGRLDREEKRGNEIWTEQSIYGSMTGHSAATVPTSRNGCCSYGARCSLASANPAAAVDGKASMPGYEKPEGTRYLQHSSYHCECSNTDDRPRRSTLPGLSSSSSSSSANTALPGRCLMRPPAVTAEPYRMDLTESSNRNPRNRLRKMASLASSLRSFAMGKRSTPSVRSERSMDSITSDSCEGHSTPTKDPSSGLVVVTTPTPIYSANGSASSFVVSANHVDATCTSELSTMCASPVDWQSSSHVRSSSSNTATTSFPFTDVLEYVPVRRGSVQEMPLRKKCSIIGSFQRRSPKDSPQMGIATDIGAMKSCPLVASASYDPTMQCTTRQNSISTDGKGSKSRPKLNIITELNPNAGAAQKSSSLVQFHWVQGRRRCDFGQGASEMLPGDQDDVDYADHLHDIIWFIARRNYFAPLLYPKRVLDIGCGSGTWMREMATSFPKSQFTGIDLVDVFARDRAPKNCRFQLANILDGMPSLAANHFDYIHQRMLVFNIPTDSYSSVFAEYHRLLRPGGFLELMECDMQLQPAGPVGTRLNAMLQMVCNSRGINLDHAASLDQSITSAGLHCIGREVLHVPVGAWAGVTGEIVARVLLGQIFSNFEDSFLRLGLLEDSSKLFSTDATFNTNNNKSDFISTTYKDSSDFGLSTESWAMPDMMTAATPGTCPTSSTDICATGLSGMTLHTVSEESSLTSANSESSSHMPQRIRWDAESRAANLADLLARFTKEVDDRQTHLLMHVFVAQKKA